MCLKQARYHETVLPYSKPLDRKVWFWSSLFALILTTGMLFHVMIGGRSGGAKVLGKLPVPGRPTIWITVGQGPTALVIGAVGGCLDIFTLIYPFLSSFSLSLGDGPI